MWIYIYLYFWNKMSKLLWFIQFIYTNFPKYSRYRELWDGHMSNNHPLFIVPTGRPFVSLSPISNDDGGCYSRRMPVIWDPFGTSCSLKQALSSQQLTDFGLNKVPTVPIAEKDQKSQKICQKSIWQRDFFLSRQDYRTEKQEHRVLGFLSCM